MIRLIGPREEESKTCACDIIAGRLQSWWSKAISPTLHRWQGKWTSSRFNAGTAESSRIIGAGSDSDAAYLLTSDVDPERPS